MIDRFVEERIKSVARIVDVVSEFHELRRSGVELSCPCPFHHGTHLGHFKVSEKKNMAYCFVCGWGGGPIDFLMAHERMSYPDALRWLGAKYGIEVDEEQKRFTTVRKSAPVPIAAPVELPTLVLPKSYVGARLDTTHNTLCNWLRSLPWDDEQRKRLESVLRYYGVGTSKDGRTIFWQIDHMANVRTGKLMAYKTDGHRDKSRNADWIHSTIARAGKLDVYDPSKQQMRPCLFGLHMLGLVKEIPQTVNIVESEKTAIICATALGSDNGLWMATGGMQFLKRETLQPLMDLDLDIVLYPDHDGKDKWVEKMRSVGYDKIHYNNAYVDAYWREGDGAKADAADIIVRMMEDSRKADKQTRLEEMIAEHPLLGELIERLTLEVA